LNPAVAFLLIRLALAAILLGLVVLILVYLRRGLRPAAPTSAGLPMARLVPTAQELASHALAGVNTIGRSPGNSITLDHPSVSSFHARLSLASGNWLLEDLGSRNGTRLNGLEVREPLAVTYGDLVQFGGVGFRLLAGGLEASIRPSGPAEAGELSLADGVESVRPASDDSERRQP